MRAIIELPSGSTAINTGNAVFYDGDTGEYAPAEELERITDKYASKPKGTSILDVNGNTVGRVGFVRRKRGETA